MILDINKVKNIHFVGIGGVAMTALAIIAKERGIQVTGADIGDQFPTDQSLRNADINVLEGFSSRHIETNRPDCVVYTGAHKGKENVEVVAAIKKGIPVFSHGQALGFFMQGKRQISVAGSHGKTTTAAMIATILSVAGKDPSYAVGCGEIFGLGLPGHFGKGEFFVAEADEYITDPSHDLTPRFLWQKPEVLVVTNIDFDHPDAYASLSDVQEAFLKLQAQEVGKKITIINTDDLPSSILNQPQNTVVTYGHVPKGNIEVSQIHFEPGKTFFTLTRRPKKTYQCTLRVPGAHNVFNAAAASAACFTLGIDWETIQRGLFQFGGTKRRFECIGESHGVTFYDDYAHHPAEIAATIAGARAWYPDNRIIVVFQPHTYSRTKALFGDFAKSFTGSDIAVICDVYASAREHDQLGLSADALANEVKKYHHNVVYAPQKDAVKKFLLDNRRKNDVVIFMGAGDIFYWGREIAREFQLSNFK